MFCKRWKPEELLPRAELLSCLLQCDSRVIGVALTGSLARLEPKIHDIDLVIFHGGSMPNGISQDPARIEPYYNDDLLLSSILTPYISRTTSQARAGVPVNYIFTGIEALWECAYLDSLAGEERMKDFYRRIFCDIPLILLHPMARFGKLIDNPVKISGISLSGNKTINGLYYHGLKIKHQCENPACQPKQSWAECREEIRLRKKHWWHW
ncbi:MAG: hypothetical protein HYT98_03935 [Candidatus Sungbacteria bacterium]|nr:hypothetical protein [Candidatus Sungbacteria bacterium]